MKRRSDFYRDVTIAPTQDGPAPAPKPQNRRTGGAAYAKSIVAAVISTKETTTDADMAKPASSASPSIHMTYTNPPT